MNMPTKNKSLGPRTIAAPEALLDIPARCFKCVLVRDDHSLAGAEERGEYARRLVPDSRFGRIEPGIARRTQRTLYEPSFALAIHLALSSSVVAHCSSITREFTRPPRTAARTALARSDPATTPTLWGISRNSFSLRLTTRR